MTADERALVQAIITAPDDDLPRLVYADWLDEHGRPERAEFIRVQCEFARAPADPGRKRDRNALLKRARALSRVHGKQWRAELLCLPEVAWGDFHRGFVASAIVVSCGPLAVGLADILSAAPVEVLQYHYFRSTELADLLASAALCRLRVLHLRSISWSLPHTEYWRAEHVAGARLLAATKWSPRTREVQLIDGSGLSEEAVEALVSAPTTRYFPVLRLTRGTILGVRARRRLLDRFGNRVLL
jgi:uncharacterized protein (TIGR02996 family)